MAGAGPSFDRAAAVAFAMDLRSAAGALQDSIDAARELQHISLPVGGPVSAKDVVDYARRISYTTFAPAGYVPGRGLLSIDRRTRPTLCSGEPSPRVCIVYEHEHP